MVIIYAAKATKQVVLLDYKKRIDFRGRSDGVVLARTERSQQHKKRKNKSLTLKLGVPKRLRSVGFF